MISYVPILKAKKGEFSALLNLSAAASASIFPILDIPVPAEKYLDVPSVAISKTAIAMGLAWQGRAAFLDISKWRPNATTENGMHVLEYAISQVAARGVVAGAVIAYDRWDDSEYSQALRSIAADNGSSFCLRLNSEGIEDMRDADYFKERVEEILTDLGVDPQNIPVVVDFGGIRQRSVSELLEKAEIAIALVREIGFISVVIAGGSMPAFVNEAVSNPNETGTVHRIEMLLWKSLYSARRDSKIIFGDYGIRNPDAMDGIQSKYNNGKIRYTVDNQFFILRGISKQIARLGLQQKSLSAILLNSPRFLRRGFSWGDDYIVRCADPSSRIMGGPTEWIAVDTNHHIHVVVSEIFEYQRRFTPQPILG